MDFNFNEEQRILKDSARNFLKDKCPSDLVRQMEKDEKGFPQEIWNKMAKLGWMGLMLPEEYGGIDWGVLDLVVLMEELGRACLPGPYLSTVIGGLAILDAGSPSQKSEILPNLTSGEEILTLAYLEPGNTKYDPTYVTTVAKQENDGFVLHGIKLFVSDAHVASRLLVTARNSGSTRSFSGISLFLVPGEIAGLTRTSLKTIAGDKQFEVVLDGVRVPQEALLGTLEEGWPVLARVLKLAAVAKCAEMVGGAQKVMEMTVDYAKEREQFGSLIGRFQAVQHHCANMLMCVEGSRYITYKAAWLLGEHKPCDLIIASAKAWVSEAYRRVVGIGHQIGAGTAYMQEHDMTLYSRRAKAAELAYGDPSYHLEQAASAIGL